MVPIREIQPEDIVAVVYHDDIKHGEIDKIKFIMSNGHSHTYHGEDLPMALAIAKERFPPQPGSTRMSDQPLKN